MLSPAARALPVCEGDLVFITVHTIVQESPISETPEPISVEKINLVAS